MPRRRTSPLGKGAGGDEQDEAYRVLRSNLLVSLTDLERPTVIVTSANSGEGKTATSVSLAISLALAGQRVVLVDLDLRHPDAYRRLGASNGPGVSEILVDRAAPRDCLQYIQVSAGERHERGLYFLPTGRSLPNPAEIVGSHRTRDLLDALAAEADIVLIDTPPVLLVADTLVIGRMVAGALLVVEARRTPVGAVQQAKDALIRNRTRLLGLVINKFEPKDAEFGYGYGYGYGYGHDGGSDEPGPDSSPARL